MKKPAVLWVGENERRCLTLMRIYADLVDSAYAENTDPGFLRKPEKSFGAIVLVLGRDERADTSVCREVYAYSAKKRVPIYLMGQRNHLHIAALISPSAFLIPVRDDQFGKIFSERGQARPAPLPAVVVFSRVSECFVYLENNLSEELREKLRIIYCEPTAEVIHRLKKKGVKPKLFVFGEDVYSGFRCYFFQALYRKAEFRKIPYLVFSVSGRKKEPDPSVPEPLGMIDIRNETINLGEYIRAAGIMK